MISEWFINLFNGFQTWIASLFGQGDPPAWLDSAASFIGDTAARASGLGAWLPWEVGGVVGGGLLTLWGVLWLVKGIRWLWGLTPLSGGS